MSYADDIVKEALEHRLSRLPDDRLVVTEDGFAVCVTCGHHVFMGVASKGGDIEAVEQGHRLYWAVTRTTEVVARMVRAER